MKTISKLALATIIGFVAGGVAGFFFRGAEIAPNLAQGDISKVSKFNRNVVSPAMSAFQEKITSNPEGKKSSVDYEQATQNLALAFMMVDRQISVGKQYVCDVDAFLRGKDVEDYKELALARDLWAGYCAGEARLTNNDEELAYWSKQQSLLASSTDILASHPTLVVFIGDVLKQCQGIDSAIGLDVNNSMLSNNEQFNTVLYKYLT